MNWLTVKEAAERARVSPEMVYQWTAEKRLPHYRAGRKGTRGKILIKPEDLDSFMETLRVAPAEPHPRRVSDRLGEPFSELDASQFAHLLKR